MSRCQLLQLLIYAKDLRYYAHRLEDVAANLSGELQVDLDKIRKQAEIDGHLLDIEPSKTPARIPTRMIDGKLELDTSNLTPEERDEMIEKLKSARCGPLTYVPEGREIRIVFRPEEPDLILCEVEDAEGKSIDIGDWRNREDGLRELVLRVV